MAHLRQCRGSTLDLDPAPDPYLCCTFWPEIRGGQGVHSRSISGQPELIGGSTPDPDPALDPYLCCTFWPNLGEGRGSTPAPVPSLSNLRGLWGVNSRSSSRSIFVFYLLTWIEGRGGGSTMAPAPVPSLSNLSWLWEVNFRKIWGQLHFFCLQKSFCCAGLDRLIGVG